MTRMSGLTTAEIWQSQTVAAFMTEIGDNTRK